MMWVAIAAASVLVATLAGRRRSKVRVGMWWDIGPAETFARWPQWSTQIRGHVTDIAVMVNDHAAARSGELWSIWTPEQLERFTRLARAAGFDVHYTAWIAPRWDLVTAILQRLAPMAQRLGCRSVELDAEREAFAMQYAQGFQSLEACVRTISDAFRRARDGLLLGCTIVPEDRNNPMARVADYVALQAYSQSPSARHDEDYDYGGRYAPGSMQALAARRAQQYGKPLVMGLKAYNQEWRADRFGDEYVADGTKAMREAFDATVALGVDEVRYWSAKWVLRSPAGSIVPDYALRFIRSIRGGAGARSVG